MNFKRTIKLIIFLAFAFVTFSFSMNKASASTREHYISSFPKETRGVWYGINKIHGKKLKVGVIITKKRALNITSDGYEYGTVLHSIHEKHVKVNKKALYEPKYAGYVINHGHKFYFDKPWDTKKNKKPDFYISVSRFKGHQILIVMTHNKDYGYFRSAKLAETYVNK